MLRTTGESGLVQVVERWRSLLKAIGHCSHHHPDPACSLYASAHSAKSSIVRPVCAFDEYHSFSRTPVRGVCINKCTASSIIHADSDFVAPDLVHSHPIRYFVFGLFAHVLELPHGCNKAAFRTRRPGFGSGPGPGAYTFLCVFLCPHRGAPGFHADLSSRRRRGLVGIEGDVCHVGWAWRPGHHGRNYKSAKQDRRDAPGHQRQMRDFIGMQFHIDLQMAALPILAILSTAARRRFRSAPGRRLSSRCWCSASAPDKSRHPCGR